MEKEFTEVYCGGGKGKTTLAIGQCLRASAQGKSVIIIQFLKGRVRRELDFLAELDNLDIKIFRFEKHDEGYEELNEQEKAEEKYGEALNEDVLKSLGEVVFQDEVYSTYILKVNK